eukprot:9468510-Pyramimonas_sp.AAC.1
MCFACHLALPHSLPPLPQRHPAPPGEAPLRQLAPAPAHMAAGERRVAPPEAGVRKRAENETICGRYRIMGSDQLYLQNKL